MAQEDIVASYPTPRLPIEGEQRGGLGSQSPLQQERGDFFFFSELKGDKQSVVYTKGLTTQLHASK